MPDETLPTVTESALRGLACKCPRCGKPNEARGDVFRNRAFALAGASQSRLGAARALQALRLILTSCHANVIGSQFTLAFANDAYDDMDRLKGQADRDGLKEMVRQLIDISQRMM